MQNNLIVLLYTRNFMERTFIKLGQTYFIDYKATPTIIVLHDDAIFGHELLKLFGGYVVWKTRHVDIMVFGFLDFKPSLLWRGWGRMRGEGGREGGRENETSEYKIEPCSNLSEVPLYKIWILSCKMTARQRANCPKCLVATTYYVYLLSIHIQLLLTTSDLQ